MPERVTLPGFNNKYSNFKLGLVSEYCHQEQKQLDQSIQYQIARIQSCKLGSQVNYVIPSKPMELGQKDSFTGLKINRTERIKSKLDVIRTKIQKIRHIYLKYVIKYTQSNRTYTIFPTCVNLHIGGGTWTTAEEANGRGESERP